MAIPFKNVSMRVAKNRPPVVFSDKQDVYTLGSHDTDVPISKSEEASDAAVTLAEQSRRLIQIFTRDLDGTVYDNERFVRAVSFLARRTPSSEVQILIQDPRPAIQSGHLLIELCQQLTSYIKVRRMNDDYLLTPDEFILVDKVGFMYRKSYKTYEGVVNFASRSKSQRLDIVFAEVWNISTADPEFRRLHI